MASFVDPRFRDAYIDDDHKEYVETKAAAEIQVLLEMQQPVSATESFPSTNPQATGAAAAAVSDEAPDVPTREAKKVKRSLKFFQKDLKSAWYSCSL